MIYFHFRRCHGTACSQNSFLMCCAAEPLQISVGGVAGAAAIFEGASDGRREKTKSHGTGGGGLEGRSEFSGRAGGVCFLFAGISLGLPGSLAAGHRP
jgi:hypothetical protein